METPPLEMDQARFNFLLAVVSYQIRMNVPSLRYGQMISLSKLILAELEKYGMVPTKTLKQMRELQ